MTSSPGVTPNQDGFDIASVLGDVDADALAVTSNGRVVAAAGTQLLVRDPNNKVEAIELPDDIVVSKVWVGTDEIAVAWGLDLGAEVDLRTGELVTHLTRVDDTWTRTEPSQADSYKVNEGRPTNPLRLGLLIDADTQSTVPDALRSSTTSHSLGRSRGPPNAAPPSTRSHHSQQADTS